MSRRGLARGLALVSCLGTACRARANETSVAPIPASELSSALKDATSAPPRAFLARFPLRVHTRWIDRIEKGGHTTEEPVEETWLPIDATTWDVVERRQTGVVADSLATRFTLRAEGILAIGARFLDAYDPYDAPRLWLPTDAHVGESWRELHALPAEPRERACRIDPSPTCPRGLAVVCTKTYSGGDIARQTQFFCESIGWTGYSVTVTDLDGKTILEHRFSEDVRDLSP